MSNESFVEKEKNIIPIESVERGLECPVVDFNSYADICNYRNDGSRRRGILSDESYEEIVDDPNTGFINSGNFRIPALMDISHGLAMGYDASRCKEYAEELSTDVKILTLPVHELNGDEKNQLTDILATSADKCALYFSDHNNDESIALGEMLDKVGVRHTEKPLVDHRAAKGDEQAALYLYSCCAEQKEDRGERKKLSLSDVQDFYDKNMGPLYTSDGKVKTILDMGEQINDQQAEEMWKIFNDRFDFLGEGHPISMQDSKEDFYRLLRSNSTMVAMTYAGDENDVMKLTCFSFYVDDMDSLYWLNVNYIDEKFPTSSAGHEHEINMYTPGIASSGKGASYAHLPIGLFIMTADKSGLSANMLFENTNLSKRYIPRVLDKAMDRACEHLDHKPSEMVDKITYRLWSIGGEDE